MLTVTLLTCLALPAADPEYGTEGYWEMVFRQSLGTIIEGGSPYYAPLISEILRNWMSPPPDLPPPADQDQWNQKLDDTSWGTLRKIWISRYLAEAADLYDLAWIAWEDPEIGHGVAYNLVTQANERLQLVLDMIRIFPGETYPVSADDVPPSKGL